MKKTAHPDHTPHSEETAAPDLEKSETAAPAAPEEETTTLKNQMEQYREQALRAAADLENYRKRMIREKEEVVRYANNALLEKLLPVMDNFELGLQAARTSNEKNPDTQAAEIINGFSMVQRQLQDFLKEHGLELIEAVGKEFDPKIHEALAHQVDETLPEGHVISQLRPGYRLAGRLLRPASVLVSKGSAQ